MRAKRKISQGLIIISTKWQGSSSYKDDYIFAILTRTQNVAKHRAIGMAEIVC